MFWEVVFHDFRERTADIWVFLSFMLRQRFFNVLLATKYAYEGILHLVLYVQHNADHSTHFHKTDANCLFKYRCVFSVVQKRMLKDGAHAEAIY